mgnify:CR=1 FL=1
MKKREFVDSRGNATSYTYEMLLLENGKQTLGNIKNITINGARILLSNAVMLEIYKDFTAHSREIVNKAIL